VLTIPSEPSAALLWQRRLSDQVTSAEIWPAVERHAGDPDQAVRELIARANAGGRQGQRDGAHRGRRRFIAPPAALPSRSFRGPLSYGTVRRGLLLAAGAAYFTRAMWIPAPVVITPRVITVTGSIAAALAEARAGDTVEVPPGEYREQVRLKDGVVLRAQIPRDATLRAAAFGTVIAQVDAAASVDRMRSR